MPEKFFAREDGGPAGTGKRLTFAQLRQRETAKYFHLRSPKLPAHRKIQRGVGVAADPRDAREVEGPALRQRHADNGGAERHETTMVEIVVVGESRDAADLHSAEGPLLADIGVAGGAGEAVAKNSDAGKPVIGAIHEPDARRAVGQLGFRRVLVQAVGLQGKMPRRLGRTGAQDKDDQTHRQGDFSHGSSVTSHGGLGSSKKAGRR